MHEINNWMTGVGITLILISIMGILIVEFT